MGDRGHDNHSYRDGDPTEHAPTAAGVTRGAVVVGRAGPAPLLLHDNETIEINTWSTGRANDDDLDRSGRGCRPRLLPPDRPIQGRRAIAVNGGHVGAVDVDLDLPPTSGERPEEPD